MKTFESFWRMIFCLFWKVWKIVAQICNNMHSSGGSGQKYWWMRFKLKDEIVNDNEKIEFEQKGRVLGWKCDTKINKITTI